MPTASAARTRRTPPAGRSGSGRRTAVSIVFYAGLLVLMALIVTKTLGAILPAGVAPHVANDSEGYTLALLLAAWIEFVRPRLARHRFRWVVAGAVTVVLLVLVTVLFRTADPLHGFKTLNEAFFGLALILLYVLPLKRPTRLVAVGIAVAIAVVVVILHPNPLDAHQSAVPFVTMRLAEGVVMVFLAPLVFDVGDRGVLTPGRRDTPRWAAPLTWVLLLVLPAVVILIRHGLSGPLLAADIYFAKAQEAWVGLLLICLYFAARGTYGRR